MDPDPVQPPPTPKKPDLRDRKPSPPSNNTLLLLILAGALVISFLVLYPVSHRIEIAYSDLVALAKQGKGGAIEVDEGTPIQPRRYRYSKLFDYSQQTKIVVGSDQIHGWIAREQIGPPTPEGTSSEKRLEFRTRWAVQPNDEILTLFKQQGFGFDGEPEPSPFKLYSWVIFWTAIFLVLAYIIFRKFTGTGSPIAFGRSRGRMYANEEIGVTFDDVAGIDEAVEEVREVVEFLKTPEKYSVLGGRIPRGVLLVGPPGTGKTLLARAIAGEAGVPFFSLSGSDFVEMFVGVGAARVRDMFAQAEAKAPCIVFIDELDALGKTRGGSIVGGHDEREQTLNALLVEMDGFSTNNGVIVLAATNRPETLDPALLRAGRFDRHVLVDRPDVRGREQILRVHTQHVKLDDQIDLKQLAAITSGFVGADLANLVNEAALLAARKGKTSAGMAEFNEGVERVTAGLEKKQRLIHEDEKQRVAYHESGHALVAYSLPNTDPVHKVSIIPRGLAALGYMLQRPEQDRYLMTQSELESRIQVLLGGTVAEEVVYGETSTGAQNDLERATALARSMVMEFGMSRLGRVNFRDSNRSQFLGPSADGPRVREHSETTAREIDEEVKNILDKALENVRKILEARRSGLDGLARTLIEKEVIDSLELRRIIEETSPTAMLAPGTVPAARISMPLPPRHVPVKEGEAQSS